MSYWQKYLSDYNEGLNMDIDIELEKIIEKYDLDKCDPAYRQRKKAQKIIKNIIASFTGKIAVIATFESDINRFQFLLKDHQADYFFLL